MFRLSNGGANVSAEVQRWQYFLRTQGIDQVGRIDARFGNNTELGTRIFQMQVGIPANGRVDEKTLEAAAGLGYRILDDDYYAQRASSSWPEKPAGLSAPSHERRNQLFDCFKFLQRSPRPDLEAIVIKGNCRGNVSEWEREYIINMQDNRFGFAVGYGGSIRCHRAAGPLIKALLDEWERESLLHLVLDYQGCFVPRYKRRRAPGRGSHPTRESKDVPELSNHAFGSAFDISTVWNELDAMPAICGERGSVRELVASANRLGFFWGGHYTSPKDGMHFEIIDI